MELHELAMTELHELAMTALRTAGVYVRFAYSHSVCIGPNSGLSTRS